MQPFFFGKIMDLYQAIARRRDTRHFTAEKLPPAVLKKALEAALAAPSVGLSQPWRFLDISSLDRRALIENFSEKRLAAEGEIADRERLERHQGLKLEALAEAPTLLAFFCAYPPASTYTIGIIGQRRALEWSCACAMQNLWLSLTAEGFGAGWVTILDLMALAQSLKVPERWEPMGVLCLGRPATDYQGKPMLEVEAWKSPKREISSFYADIQDGDFLTRLES